MRNASLKKVSAPAAPRWVSNEALRSTARPRVHAYLGPAHARTLASSRARAEIAQIVRGHEAAWRAFRCHFARSYSPRRRRVPKPSFRLAVAFRAGRSDRSGLGTYCRGPAKTKLSSRAVRAALARHLIDVASSTSTR